MSHCVFCAIIEGRLPAVKLYEDERVLAFMDIFPLRRGHLLVIPKTHRRQLHELDSSLRSHLVDTATRMAQALHHCALAPAAVHYQVNDGPAANQTVPHVHMHVLPRYRGDTGRFLLRLLRKPLDPALGPTGSATLEADAALIREGLARLP